MIRTRSSPGAGGMPTLLMDHRPVWSPATTRIGVRVACCASKEPAKEAVVAGSKWNRDLDVAHPTHTRRGRRQFADLRHINVKGDRHPIVNR